MDIRGVEVTNQLRSAIRAKLLELEVRYDDELPDYILVMVVNKKTREQMNEDLSLFLESSTGQFVDWLHDQVLKKLQKVTVSKKKEKNNKDSAVAQVKSEADNEKVKSEKTECPSKPKTKVERDAEFDELVGDLTFLSEAADKTQLKENNKAENHSSPDKSNSNSKQSEKQNISSSTIVTNKSTEESCTPPRPVDASSTALTPEKNKIDSRKRTKNSSHSSNEETDDDSPVSKRSKNYSNVPPKDDVRLKSAVIKPRITSVVSVKSRVDLNKKYSPVKFHSDSHSSSTSRNHQESKRKELFSQTSNQNDTVDKKRHHHKESNSVLNSCDDNSRNKFNKTDDEQEKTKSTNRPSTIKSRLGTIINHRREKSPVVKSSISSKVIDNRPTSNIKSRLGKKTKDSKVITSIESRLFKLAQNDTFEEEDVISDISESEKINSLKSNVIPPKSSTLKNKMYTGSEEDESIFEEEDDDQCKVPSKIIVTPRPLQPLQPSQKRATQSLLFKAVAEANKSVVLRKQPDPCLKEKRVLKKSKITRERRGGQIISINLNKKKRSAADKIKVELKNKKKLKSTRRNESPDIPDESLSLVKSLFKRSDNKQKFVVTMNGLNNNSPDDKPIEDEPCIELLDDDDDEDWTFPYVPCEQYDFNDENDEVIIDCEIDRQKSGSKVETESKSKKHKHKKRSYTPEKKSKDSKSTNRDKKSCDREDSYKYHQSSQSIQSVDDSIKEPEYAINTIDTTGQTMHQPATNVMSYIETNTNPILQQFIASNHTNYLNYSTAEDPYSRKRKNVSPIVFNRSRSKSPKISRHHPYSTLSRPQAVNPVPAGLRLDKRPIVSSVIKTVATTKTTEQCRYWPTCTLGSKCAYVHPPVLCSSFPNCKFGDKCSYKHPNCKFGTACTKLGCKFSHPPKLCKYHPYCMKPGCPFSHPKKKMIPSGLAPTPDLTEMRAKFTWTKKD
ncbi:hypothetical protein TKK_0003463 [Trichogramma kaykai]|uniref:Zinc finger CCCH domain-containing protein 14 n=1 Tax=Trichogramma kaykai TaxID=54128 RepID=A0ABD2XQK1_9HYME